MSSTADPSAPTGSLPLDARPVSMAISGAFFGWLVATALSVLLLAVLTGLDAVIVTLWDTAVTEPAAGSTGAVLGVAVAVLAALVAVSVAYFCGGYVAGRVARSHGIRQGVAVWSWGTLVAVVLVTLAVVAGTQTGLVDRLSASVIAVSTSQASVAALVGGGSVAVVALVGAVLGGLAATGFEIPGPAHLRAATDRSVVSTQSEQNALW